MKEPEIKTYMNTVVGNDQFGKTLKKNLETNGNDKKWHPSTQQ